MTSENAESNPAEGAVTPRLAWSTAPVWADRWQGKYDSEQTAPGRFDCAARILAAAVHKAAPNDTLLDQVSALLIATATSLGAHAAVPRPALQDAPLVAPQPPAPLPPKPHTVTGGIIDISRRCPCDYCTDFYRELDR